MGRRWVGGIVLGLGLALAVRAAPCKLGWSSSLMSIWVGDDPGYHTQSIANDWRLGVTCSAGDSTVCRATFGESLCRLNPVTNQYDWVMGFQGNPVPFACGSQAVMDTGKIFWSYWPDGSYMFTYEMTEAGGGGQLIYSGYSLFSVPGA
jgi:hypothetical protein